MKKSTYYMFSEKQNRYSWEDEFESDNSLSANCFFIKIRENGIINKTSYYEYEHYDYFFKDYLNFKSVKIARIFDPFGNRKRDSYNSFFYIEIKDDNNQTKIISFHVDRYYVVESVIERIKNFIFFLIEYKPLTIREFDFAYELDKYKKEAVHYKEQFLKKHK